MCHTVAGTADSGGAAVARERSSMARSLEQVALALGGIRRDVDARRLEPMRPVRGNKGDS
jgi:hypothetical protein